MALIHRRRRRTVRSSFPHATAFGRFAGQSAARCGGRRFMARGAATAVLVSCLAFVAVGCRGGTHAAGATGNVLRERVIDDFEGNNQARYVALREVGSTAAIGRAAFRRVACDRSGTPGHCLRLRYRFDAEGSGELGLRLLLGDVDASRFDRVAFWIKGDASAGFSTSLKVGFRQVPSSSGLVETGSQVVEGIGPEWRRIEVPLNRMSGIQDWSHLGELFVSLESRRMTAPAGAYFIDDVVLLRTGRPGPSISDRVVAHKKEAWEAALGGPDKAKLQIQTLLRGWPRRLLADRRALPRSDRRFLLRLALDTWRGLDAFTHRDNGLPIDHVRFGADSVDPAAAHIGDYTNVTNIGLHLIATAAAYELDFLSRTEALERMRRVLSTLRRLESYRGFYFNYYDATSLERTSNFVSFVDSSWLTAGLMVARAEFPELSAECSDIIAAGDYAFFYDDVVQQMSHGYYVNVPTRSEYHYGVLYSESRVGSLIAIGKGDVPEEHWFRLTRTFPAWRIWQTQRPYDRRLKTVRGFRFYGGYYEWEGHRYVPSWGGSMFEALMPTLVVDERKYAPKSLGRNDEVHAAVQRLWATERGYPVWGLSPSVNAAGDSYGESGVKVLGSRGYGPGPVTPHAAALALNATPEEALADLRKLVELYDIYGDYGFYDAVDPASGGVAHEYLALDQAMVFISLANHLKDHCIQKRFAADPIAQRVLPTLADEDFFH